MSADPAISVIFQVGLLIVVSSLGSELFKKLKLPGVIGAILVGLFIGGPGGLGLVTDLTVINLLAVLGSILILFTTGLEFDASAFWKVGKTAFLLTTVGVILSVLLGYGIGLVLGFSWQAAFLLGAVLAPSGTSVIAAMLSYEGAVESKLGSTLLTAVVLDDIEGILILTIALGVFREGVFSATSLISIGLIATLFILASIYIGSKILPVVIKKFEWVISDEVLFIILLGLGLMLAFASTQVGLAAVTGAFIMGAIIPYQKVGKKLAEKISMMKEIFAAVFFTSIGLVISPMGMLAFLPVGSIILGVALLARFAGGLLGGRLTGLKGKTLWAVTIGLAVRAEMSFIIAYEGVAMGIVGTDFLTLTAIAVIGSMIVVLPLFSKLVKGNLDLTT
ncbi:cation:proton antiporter [Candidatus Bathyarchaeota archaeon A05DMB-2]|jgi:CPA2 family monovalent cation:H+ antiporter-2|nr:cation:proton antiporter [Candidatus Bathyarchaeota archaeon A05DMB-2]